MHTLNNNLEYVGEIIDAKTAEMRDQRLQEIKQMTSYLLFFKFGQKKMCLDATYESSNTRYGRLVNHSVMRPNIKPKLVVVNSVPRIVFVAIIDIEKNTELVYDYGDRNVEALASNSWMANS